MDNEMLKKYYGMIVKYWDLLREYLDRDPSEPSWEKVKEKSKQLYQEYKGFRENLAHDLSVVVLAEIRRVYEEGGIKCET